MSKSDTGGNAMEEYAAYVGSCHKRGVLPCSFESFCATLQPDVRTWRERIGKAPTYPLHAPNDVERAMVAEIAELRELSVSRPPAPKAMAGGRQLIVVGGQAVSMGALLDLQRDAARYRWLRDKADGMVCTAAPMVASLAEDGRMVGLIDGEELDAAVDIVMAQTASRRAAKSKADCALPAGSATAVGAHEIAALLRDLDRVAAESTGEAIGVCQWASTVITSLLAARDKEGLS